MRGRPTQLCWTLRTTSKWHPSCMPSEAKDTLLPSLIPYKESLKALGLRKLDSLQAGEQVLLAAELLHNHVTNRLYQNDEACRGNSKLAALLQVAPKSLDAAALAKQLGLALPTSDSRQAWIIPISESNTLSRTLQAYSCCRSFCMGHVLRVGDKQKLWSLPQIVDRMQTAYCGTLAVELTHLATRCAHFHVGWPCSCLLPKHARVAVLLNTIWPIRWALGLSQ